MRPVLLTMTAFGPYAATEAVDFRGATDAGLFGIYGATGSGKSSIFNAMTFALFGEGAKREQAIGTMRSGHADADRLTEVSLLFELGEKRYFVRRQPDQTRPKKRGDGETTDAHKAWLFDATLVPVDEVTVDNCGTVLAETKVSEVLRQVKELLGYGVEQFRQIVLLPQGRFERFLVADSDQRLAILRELFDVSLYQRLAARMKDDAAAAKREYQDGRRVVGQRLADVGFASTDELAAGIAAAAEAAAARHVEADGAEAAAGIAEQAHLAAETVEGLFGAAQKAESRKLDLLREQPAVDALQLVVTRAEKAQRAVDLASRLTEMDASRCIAVEAEEKTRGAARDAQIEHGRCEEAFRIAKEGAERIDGLKARIVEIDRRKELLLSAEGLDAKLAVRRTELRAAQTAFDVAEAERARLDRLRIDLADRVDGARRTSVARAGLSAKLISANADLAAAKAHDAAERKSVKAKEDLAEARKAHDAAAGEVDPLRAAAAAAERSFIDAQAQVLAGKHLVDGEPCPVCGSAEHPSPARGEGDPQEFEIAMRCARRLLDEAVRRANRAEADVASAGTVSKEREAEFNALPRSASSIAEAVKVVTEVEAGIEALGEVVPPAELEQQAAAAGTDLAAAVAAAEGTREILQKARTDEAVAARAYDDAIAGVPEPLRAPGVLDGEAVEVSATIRTLSDALADADEGLRKAATDRDTTAAGVIAATDAVARAENAAGKARAAFEARLVEVGLDQASYALGCADIPKISEHAERIGTHRKEVALAEAQATAALDAITGVERPDVMALSAVRDDARAERLRTRQVAADAEAARKVLDDLLASLRDQLARLDRLEEETGPLRELAEAFAGENPLRTSLETFAIGAMFDHVLDAANLRLDPMTAGRYRFEREVQAVGGRTRRGLDVRVHDVQTGRPREISTLSGGETFIAALSLALGLSDVVEMSHGRIRLDTIFIDEGFGSLDTENDGGTLDRVLHVLQEIVGRNRAVGLISHVPLVQQAVPNGFSIVKGIGGSRVERRAM